MRQSATHRRSTRRLTVAFAAAILLHAIFAASIPATAPSRTEQEEIVAIASIAHVRPTPKPTPSPTPTLREARRNSASTPVHREIVRHAGAARPKPSTLPRTKPIWEIPAGAHGAGTGRGLGAGGLGGGASGSGAAQPCGYVEFSDPHGVRHDAQTGGDWVEVEMTVHFPNRGAESLLLDYSWYYPNAATDPWAQQNLDDPNFPTKFQNPPPGQRAGEPALVQYVIAHSSPDGRTLLKDCP